MKKQQLLPFPFDRAVILLTKEKRFSEALELCEYVKEWCDTAEREYDGWSAMHWKSRKLQGLVERIPKLKGKLK